MSTWLNGREPPYMNGTEKQKLTKEQAAHAACCLTYTASKYAAAAAILLLSKLGYTPAQINDFLHEESKITIGETK